MVRDTWALLGVFAAGFLLLGGLILGVYDRLDARIESLDIKLSNEIKQLDIKLSNEIKQLDEKLSSEIKRVNAELSDDIKQLQLGQAVIGERLVRLETVAGVADLDLSAVIPDEVRRTP